MKGKDVKRFFESKIWFGFVLAGWVVIGAADIDAQLEIAKIPVSKDVFFLGVIVFFGIVILLDWTIKTLYRIAPRWQRLLEKLRSFGTIKQTEETSDEQ